MFKLIYLLLPLLLGVIYYFFSRKRKLLDWNIRKGVICYNCKEDMNLDDGILLSRVLDLTDFKILCKVCNRENKISQLKKPYLKWKFQFQSFVVSKKFKKIYWIFPTIICSIIFIDTLSIFLDHRLELWPIYGTLNLIFYFLFFYKLKYTTIKKPSE